MKTFLITIRIIGIVLILALGWGVLCPMLISSPTDIGVIVGIAMIIVVPVLAYIVFRPVIKAIKKLAKDDYGQYWRGTPIIIFGIILLTSCMRTEDSHKSASVKSIPGAQPIMVLNTGSPFTGSNVNIYKIEIDGNTYIVAVGLSSSKSVAITKTN